VDIGVVLSFAKGIALGALVINEILNLVLNHSHQYVHAKRLRDVVGYTTTVRINFIHILRFGRHHNDEVGKSRLPQVSAYLCALFAGQHPIKQHDIWFLFQYQLFGLITITGLYNRIALCYTSEIYLYTEITSVIIDF